MAFNVDKALESLDTEDGVVLEVVVDDADMVDEEEMENVSSHDENLAEALIEAGMEDELRSMAAELIQHFENDKRSRKDWVTTYIDGLDLLGMKIETRQEPWPGAAGMYHPMLSEAVVRFQAQAMGELFPASGPCRDKIMGKKTTEKVKQASRVVDEMNYQLTERMTEYRDEMEQMLFRVALAGSAFKKVYYDPIRERPVSLFVPAEDFIVGYGASDLATCDRYTHVMKKSPHEVFRLQIEGFYRMCDLPEPTPDTSDIEEKYNELSGQDIVIEDDDRHTLLEMHVTMNMPEMFDDPQGIARPYIVTIEKSSRKILSIRRNWYEDDPKQEKRMHFAHYRYLPGMGFYGMGLIHMIGGLAKSATSLLRQLVDAGTLSNLPGGLKARGMRIKGDNTPIKPGEFRDVDVPGGTIRESITFLPYKEPSAVLYSLLGNVVEEGRRIGSIADVDVGDMNAQAPVGTTLALMERSLKVMSGVQARMHAALKIELRLIAKVIHDYMGPEYDYDMSGDFNRTEDFDGRVDIIPVSDPNASTMAQRVVQHQAALQMAAQDPTAYNKPLLHRRMMEALNIQDPEEIVKLPDELKPMDPVAENMAVLKQEPVKVHGYQDHQAHIQVHMAAMQDPKIQQMVAQSPFASAIQASAAAHITEHLAWQYRRELQQKLGAELPGVDEALPEDLEREVSRMAAAAADKLLRANQTEVAAKQAEQAENDPLTKIQQRELAVKERAQALKEAEAEHDAIMDLAKLIAEDGRVAADAELRGTDLLARVMTQLEQIKVQKEQRNANGPNGSAGQPQIQTGGGSGQPS